jgi:anti-sigma B factor antagonist
MSRVVLTQAGELDIATAHGLFERLEPYRRPGCDVLLDLRAVTFMDCYTLGLIVGAHAASATEGWTLRVLVEAPPVVRLLDLTGASRLLPIEVATPTA